MCIQLLLVSVLLLAFVYPFSSSREFSGFTPHQCPVISKFWIAFQSWWFANHGKIMTPTKRDILFGWHDNATESKDTLNYITLVAKYYIFCTTQDSDEASFDGFPSFLKNKLDEREHSGLEESRNDRK